MHTLRVLLAVGFCGLAAAPGCAHAPAHDEAAAVPLSEPLKAPKALTVSSRNFADGQLMSLAQVFSGFGCTGQNLSPALTWSGAPAGTLSYAIVAHDPDAPTGVGFFHWLVFNLPATVTHLDTGAAASLPPGAVHGRTDLGTNGYGGPCPPPGAPHRYIFTVYALDVARLELDPSTSGALLRFQMNPHVLAYGRTTGVFAR